MKSLNRLICSALIATVIAVSAFVTAPVAQAAPVYSGIVNLAVPSNGIGLYLNVATGSTYTGPSTFPSSTTTGFNWDLNFYGTTTWSTFAPGSTTSGQTSAVPTTSTGFIATTTTGPIAVLTPGTTISASSVINTGSASPSGLVGLTDALFGFRFRNENDVANTADDTVHYGWARITLVNGVPGNLKDYGYESTPLTAIAAAAGAAVTVPEAGTLPLVLGAFATLGAGVLVRRRK